MSVWSWAFQSNAELGSSELPEIYSLSLAAETFIESDIHNTYLKILTDCMERVHGLPKNLEPVLWDNCVQSEANRGLISLLADAMTCNTDLFLVFSNSTKVLRKATFEEQEKIRADYQANNESPVGVFISFKNYRRTEMLRIYSGLEYCVLASLYKSLNLAKAIQVKISELRSSVSLSDSAVAKEQARSIACSLSKGLDVYLDQKDEIVTAQIDTAPTEKAVLFLDSKRAFILGLPLAYINGEQTGGIGTTGEADARAVERGLRQYYVTILKPVLFAIFKKETEFKSQDFRQMTTALEVLKTFDLVSDENMSKESKQEIVARVFDLDPEEEKKQIEEDAANADETPQPQPEVQPKGENQ